MGKFGTTIPDPAGGDYGSTEYCNQSVIMEIEVKTTKGKGEGTGVIAGKTTMQLNLIAETFCQPNKADNVTTLQVTQSKISDKEAGFEASDSEYKPKNEDMCDPFRNLATGGWFGPSAGMLNSDDFTDLGRDVINETNNLPGFKMADFMSEVCKTPGGGDGWYIITLFCGKNVGKCNTKSGSSVSQSFGVATRSAMECNKVIKITLDIPGPFNIPIENVTTPVANIDPCAMSALLDCWQKAPEASTGLGFNLATVGDLLSNDPLLQEHIDEAAKEVIDSFTSNCKIIIKRRKKY